MKLPPDVNFLFMVMMQGALKMKEMGKPKEEFLFFAEEIWNTMELNDENKLRDTLQQSMLKDLEKLVDKK